MIEFHGRLSGRPRDRMIRRLERFDPVWCEEPVAPECLDLLAEVKRQVRPPDRRRRTALHAGRLLPADPRCGPPTSCRWTWPTAAASWPARRSPRWPQAQDLRVAPHCSIGPVALAACLHFDVSTPNFMIQEAFAEFDVPWRNDLVGGWNPMRDGEFVLADAPGPGPGARRGGDRRASVRRARVPEPVGQRLADELHADRVTDGGPPRATFPRRTHRRLPRRTRRRRLRRRRARPPRRQPDVRCHFLTDLAPRPATRLLVAALFAGSDARSTSEDVDGLIVLRPWVKQSTFAAGAGDLVVIGRSGAGYDKIDVAACTEHGVAVFNAPLALNHSTARRRCCSCWPWPSACSSRSGSRREGRWDLQAAGPGQRDPGPHARHRRPGPQRPRAGAAGRSVRDATSSPIRRTPIPAQAACARRPADVARRAAAPVRFRQPALPADRRDPRTDRRGAAGPDEADGVLHQRRARRAGRPAALVEALGGRRRSPGPASTCSRSSRCRWTTR